MYNLTPTQQTLLRSIVEKVRAKQMPEEFTFIWGTEGGFLHYQDAAGFYPAPDVTKGAIDALAANHLLHVRTEPGNKFGVDIARLPARHTKQLTRTLRLQTHLLFDISPHSRISPLLTRN
jgi:hypothetical protein